MLAYKLVVWLVFIERADYPVAVGPGVDAFAVRFESVRFPEAHKIQPMRRPSLAITRAGQHLVDQLGVRVARGIIDKSIHLFRRRRQPVHHQIQPPNQRALVRARIELQSFRLQPHLHEGIDWMHKPRRARPRNFLERPVIHPVHRLRTEVFGPVRALIDPGSDKANGLGVEGIALGRHHDFLVQSGNEMNQRTLGAVAGNDGFAHFATFEGQFGDVDTVAALLLIGAMALHAVLLKEGPDFLFEINHLLGRRRQFLQVDGERPQAGG